MNIRPIGAQVLVKPLPRESVSAGGIVIPDTARGRDKEVAQYGEVVGVGNGHRIRCDVEQIHHEPNVVPLDVRVGDRIVYGNWLGQEIDIDGVKHQLIHEQHVLAVIE